MAATSSPYRKTATGIASQASWFIKVTKQSAESVKNGWFSFESPNGNIRVQKVVKVDPLTQAPQAEYVVGEYATGKYWAKVGEQTEYDQLYRVDATYTSCEDDSLIYRHGYGYTEPATPDVLSCRTAGDILYLQPLEMRWEMHLKTPSVIRFCDSSIGDTKFEVKLVNTGAGDGSNIRITIPPTDGLTVRDGTSRLLWKDREYPISNPTLSDGTYTWNISTDSQSPVHTLYNPHSHAADSVTMTLIFDVKTDCDFESHSRAQIQGTVNGSCGDSKITQPSLRLVMREGLPNPTYNEYEVSIASNLSLLTDAEEYFTIHVKRTLGSELTDATREKVYIQLPDGVDYVTGSWTNVAGAEGMNLLSNTVANGVRNVIFSMPGGLGGVSNIPPMEYKFPIKLKMTAPAKLRSDSTYNIQVQTRYHTDGWNCGTDACLPRDIITTSNEPLTKLAVSGEAIDIKTTILCGSPDYIIEIRPSQGVTIEGGNTIAGTLSKPGVHYIPLTAINAKGERIPYAVRVEYRLPFDDLVISRYGNKLAVVNNPDNNGDLTFHWYRWWHKAEGSSDFVAAGNAQIFSAGTGYEQLNPCDQWWVEAVTLSGDTIRTCESVPCDLPVQPRRNSVFGYPNPVPASTILTIDADVNDEQLREAVIYVYNETGTLLHTLPVTGKVTTVQTPAAPGLYLYIFQAKDGFRKSFKMIVQ